MKNNVRIGLTKDEVNKSRGKEVYYYSWLDRFENAEPIKTVIDSEVFSVGNNHTCFIKGFTAVVAISHLSFDYYPQRTLSKKRREAKECYADYLRSETSLSFIDFAVQNKECKQKYR